MPPLSGPIPETRELTVLTSDVLSLAVEILQALRTAAQMQPLPPSPPFPPLRPLSPCLVAERAVRGVGNRSRSPRRSRSRELDLSEIGSHASSHASSPVPTPYWSGGETALVPCRRATVKRPSHKMWSDALGGARASLVSEGIEPRGKVIKRAQEVVKKSKMEDKERFEQEEERARQGEAQHNNHER